MKTYPRLLFASILFILPIIGCQPVSVTPQQQTVTPPLIPPSPSSTPFRPTKTVEPTPTITGTPTPVLIKEHLQKCQWNFAEAHRRTIKFDGSIAYLDEHEKKVFLMNGNPSSTTTLPVLWDENYVFYGFSFDGNWLAYGYRPSFTKLVSYDGKLKETNLNSEESYSVCKDTLEFPRRSSKDFINEGRTKSTISSGPSRIFDLIGKPDQYQLIYFPYTEKLADKINTLPDFNESLRSYVFPSPDNSRIFYIGLVQNQRTYILRDSSLKKQIWSKLRTANWGYDRLLGWAPDSSKFALLTEHNGKAAINFISRNGDDLGFIPTDLDFEPYIYYLKITWSPDSRYFIICIPNFTDLANSGTFYVYDMKSNKYTFQCPVSMVNPHWGWVSNKYIAYSSPVTGLVLIDPQTGLLMDLVDGKFLGWSNKPFFMGILPTPTITSTPRIKTPEE